MKIHGLRKHLSMALALCLVTGAVLAGCGSNDEAAQSTPDEPTTIKYMVFSPEAADAYTKLDLIGSFKKVKPSVTVEIERVKDSGEFENTLKIRKAANELPDIMPMKAYMLADFKDALEPLNDLEAAKVNMYAEQFAIDGNILGVSESMFNEFVWYSKSIFNEYNLQIPTTWDELINVCNTIKAGEKYIPILMGGKDAWPDYPFNEYMPALEANDGALWNTMAGQDEPFSKDKPFYIAYSKVKKLYDSNPFGSDPLGAGQDQVKTMLGTRGAMIASGAWFLADAKKVDNGKNDIGTFFLPVRNSTSDKFNTITTVDGFFATPKGGKNLAASRDFINFLFSKEFYVPYLTERGLVSVVEGVSVDLDPILQEAYDNQPDVNYVVYDGGNTEFQRIQAATKFDVKKMGQEMMAGKDLDKMMDDLNKNWKAARTSK
jgi:raffinose/stachyose/melibiose transport system substrate-binding protein